MDKISYLKEQIFNKKDLTLQNFMIFFSEINKYAKLRDKTVLDIGCGLGNFLIICNIFGKAKECYGLDSAMGRGSKKDILEIFKKNIDELNLNNMHIIKADILDHDFGVLKFDVINATYSLHHIILTQKNLLKEKDVRNETINFFKKILGLLKDNGVFVIRELAGNNLKIYSNIIRKIYKLGPDNVDYSTKHSAKEYSRLLKKAGFKKVLIKYTAPIVRSIDLSFILGNRIGSFLTNYPYHIFAYKG